MKKRIFASLLALALLVSLTGCGTVLSAWKEVMGGNEPPPPGSSGPSAPASSAPEPSARPSLPGGERPSTPAPLKEPESSEPIPLEELMLERLRDEIRASGNTVGVAFLGYVDSDSSEVDLRDYMYQSELGSTYYFLPMSWLLMYEGQELYAIVPASETATVTIYAFDVFEDGEYAVDTSAPLSVSEPGEPIVVMCNLSEIYSNVLISVTDGDETLEFHPMLSMEDGHLAETPGVYDFSIYLDMPDEATVQLATERLMQMEEVRAAMQQGMVLLNTDIVQRIGGHNCLLFTLGTDHEDHYVSEILLAVSDEFIFIYDPIYDVWNTYLG